MAYHRTRYFRRFRVTFNITTQHNSTTITLPISVCTSLRLVLKKSVKHIRSLRTSKVVWRSSKICTFRCRRYKSKGCNIQKGHVEIVILQDHHKNATPISITVVRRKFILKITKNATTLREIMFTKTNDEKQYDSRKNSIKRLTISHLLHAVNNDSS